MEISLNYNYQNINYCSGCSGYLVDNTNNESEQISSRNKNTVTYDVTAPVITSINNFETGAASSNTYYDTLIDESKDSILYNPEAHNASGCSGVSGSSEVSPSSGINYMNFYNCAAGQNLAQIAYNNAPKKFTKKCATYVKNALVEAGLLDKYVSGDGWQVANILHSSDKFIEIPVTDDNYKNLPAGCVLVFGKGVSGYSSTAGHTEITLGDGRAVSDGITRNIRRPTAIFVPC